DEVARREAAAGPPHLPLRALAAVEHQQLALTVHQDRADVAPNRRAAGGGAQECDADHLGRSAGRGRANNQSSEYAAYSSRAHGVNAGAMSPASHSATITKERMRARRAPRFQFCASAIPVRSPLRARASTASRARNVSTLCRSAPNAARTRRTSTAMKPRTARM